MLVSDGQNYCYIIYTKIEAKKHPYCHIQYISDPEQFSKYSKDIRYQIYRNDNTRLIVVDSRLVSSIKIPLSFILPFEIISLYKSSNLTPEKIDNLYSENILLNLRNIPALTEIKQQIRSAITHALFGSRS